MLNTVEAVQDLGPTGGSTRSRLMRAEDGRVFIVKFRSRAGGPRLLTNELLASLLAQQLELPVPQAALVRVTPELLAGTLALQAQGCQPGLQFGSLHLAPPGSGTALISRPGAAAHRVRQLRVFLGIMAFDQWTCNTDRRQAVFRSRPRQHVWEVFFVDHGGCFGGENWHFADTPRRGLCDCPDIYAQARDWCSFDPWLTRITDFRLSQLMTTAAQVPEEWIGADAPLFWAMVATLWERRRRVPELLADCTRIRQLFPNWSVARPLH